MENAIQDMMAKEQPKIIMKKKASVPKIVKLNSEEKLVQDSSSEKMDSHIQQISTIQLTDDGLMLQNPEASVDKIEIGSHILNIVEEENTQSAVLGENSNLMSSRFNEVKAKEPSIKSKDQK